MVEDDPVELLEPMNGVISTGGSLASFVSFDTHTNICFLNHGNIIGSITDCTGDWVAQIF